MTLNRTTLTGTDDPLVLSITVTVRLNELDWFPIMISDEGLVTFGAATSFTVNVPVTVPFRLLDVSFASMRTVYAPLSLTIVVLKFAVNIDVTPTRCPIRLVNVPLGDVTLNRTVLTLTVLLLVLSITVTFMAKFWLWLPGVKLKTNPVTFGAIVSLTLNVELTVALWKLLVSFASNK